MKAFSLEVVNNALRLLSAFSALLLALLPARKSSELGVQELQAVSRGPRIPAWMEE